MPLGIYYIIDLTGIFVCPEIMGDNSITVTLSAIAFRFDTPVPTWRKVMLRIFCAQMVGKPVIAPDPAATPAVASPAVASKERRGRPVDLVSDIVLGSPSSAIRRCGNWWGDG